MEDGLSCFFARIHDEAEAIFFQTGFFRDLLHNKEEVGEVFVVLFVESQNVVDMFFRNDKDMNRCSGLDILECKPVVIFVNFGARDFAGSDLAENAVRHGDSSLNRK